MICSVACLNFVPGYFTCSLHEIVARNTIHNFMCHANEYILLVNRNQKKEQSKYTSISVKSLLYVKNRINKITFYRPEINELYK